MDSSLFRTDIPELTGLSVSLDGPARRVGTPAGTASVRMLAADPSW